MKAITIYQPFAQLCVLGWKNIETRPRTTNIRGRIAVHAGRLDPRRYQPHALEAIERVLSELGRSLPDPLPLGAVVGTVDIVDCLKVAENDTVFKQAHISHSGILESGAERICGLEYLCGDYTPGRYAWILKNPVLFPCSIPARGKQGWWNWNEMEE